MLASTLVPIPGFVPPIAAELAELKPLAMPLTVVEL